MISPARWTPVLLAFATAMLAVTPAHAATAEVKLDQTFLAALVEKLPPCPFDKSGQYRGTVQAFRLVAIDPRSRRFLVTCQVAGESRPPVTGPLSARADRNGDRWRAFRFDVRAGLNLEAGPDGSPRLRVEVDEVKRRELEGVAGILARFLGKYFDDMVTQIASGKASLLSDKLNAEIRRKITAFQEYGVFRGIDYGPNEILLRFDLTRLRREGVAAYVFEGPHPGAVPLTRWLNRRRGSHLYTVDPRGPDRVLYQGEGVVCHVSTRPSEGAVPLYQWSSPKDHFYTTALDGEGVSRLGYRLDGVTGYVHNSPKPGTVPLYRFVDPHTGQHFYTTHPHAEFAK
jgi:hypothetical protein